MLRFLSLPRTVVGLTAFIAVGLLSARSAKAIPDFYKEFEKIYVTDETDEEYAKLVKKAKCHVCHQGRSKKNRNPYGEAFMGLLTKKDKTKKDPEVQQKVIDAIKKVGKMPSDKEDKKSPTYDELIAKEKLPGGELEEVKKEPVEEDDDDDKEGSDKK